MGKKPSNCYKNIRPDVVNIDISMLEMGTMANSVVSVRYVNLLL